MTREMLQEKSLNDLREIAKLQGVKSLTKYRKNELVDIIMNGGASPAATAAEESAAEAEPSAAAAPEAAPIPRQDSMPAEQMPESMAQSRGQYTPSYQAQNRPMGYQQNNYRKPYQQQGYQQRQYNYNNQNRYQNHNRD